MLKKIGMFLGLLGIGLFLGVVFYRALPVSAKITPTPLIKEARKPIDPNRPRDIMPIEEARRPIDPNRPRDIMPIEGKNINQYASAPGR